MNDNPQIRRGRVVGVHISSGGIPKFDRSEVWVTKSGLQGDGHDHEKHYRPEQAVCLQDEEVLRELQWEGFPVTPGTTGENVTLRGLYVNQLPLGTRLIFDSGAQILLTKVRKPCYVLDAISPYLKEAVMDRCGRYASVLQEGWIRCGDEVTAVWDESLS